MLNSGFSIHEVQLAGRIALVGIGSELNGDDAAGLWVVRGLQTRLTTRPQILLLETGTLPENSSGPLRRFTPDYVILVDAADFGGEPGEIRWLDLSDVGGLSASSHSLPLSVLGDFLARELNCKVYLLGIQPQSLEFAAPLNVAVQKSVDEIVDLFDQFFAQNG